MDEINSHSCITTNRFTLTARKYSLKSWLCFNLGCRDVSYFQLTPQHYKFWFQEAENTVLPKEGTLKLLYYVAMNNSHESNPRIWPKVVQIRFVILSSGFVFNFFSMINLISKTCNGPVMLPF